MSKRNVVAAALVALAVVGLSFAYSRRLFDALLEQIEIDELERIPVLAEEPF
jgi:hypothetical protein